MYHVTSFTQHHVFKVPPAGVHVIASFLVRPKDLRRPDTPHLIHPPDGHVGRFHLLATWCGSEDKSILQITVRATTIMPLQGRTWPLCTPSPFWAKPGRPLISGSGVRTAVCILSTALLSEASYTWRHDTHGTTRCPSAHSCPSQAVPH